MMRFRLLPVVIVAMLAACATTSPPQTRFVTTQPPETLVASIRAAAGNDEDELAVQPLRDPHVEDLRQQAVQLERNHLYRAAATVLDQALAINPDDPAVLQERAEVAILLRDFDQAETLARHAYESGAKVGPLCRRHWATIEQVRIANDDAVNAASAKAQIETCKVAGQNRF